MVVHQAGGLSQISTQDFTAAEPRLKSAAIGKTGKGVLHSGRGATWGPLLLGVYGLGLIAAGVFATDPALGYPPGAPLLL